MKNYLYPFLIFIGALFIRLVWLSSVPNGFHMDEAANTYVGRFILQNGKDLYGNSWPILYFDKFGDYPPVLPMYLSGLATYIFGVGVFASRFPAALLGSLIIFPFYSLVKNLFSKPLAITSSLVLMILPWHVVLSRASSEGIIGLTVFVWSLDLLFKYISNKTPKTLLYSVLLFGLSYLLYPSFRLLVPLALLPIPLLVPQRNTRNILIGCTVLFVLITAIISTTSWGKGRFNQTSLFLNPTDKVVIQNDLQVQITAEGNNSATVAHIFHNKPIAYGHRLLDQYVSYFSPYFLFIEGGLPQRYRVYHAGVLYITLLLLGVFFIAFNKITLKRTNFLYWGYLLLVAPIPAAITVDDYPNVHRAILMLVPLSLFSGVLVLNFWTVVKTLKPLFKTTLLTLFTVIFLAELLYVSHQYFSLSGKIDSFNRSDGNTQMAQWLIGNNKNFKIIIAPNDNWLPIYYLLISHNFNPSLAGKFQKALLIPTLDNIHFIEDYCPAKHDITHYKDVKDMLIIVDGNCSVKPYYTQISTIQRIDSTAAYRLLKINQNFDNPLYE